ncbi:hypothetical protein [Aeromicrobium ginsengisoli]|uniref:DUF3558 domain-containing protein n=1 Tax=Aeromicrobium ginsengisoli TaxID=363867 RepID=A0A5M4FCQ0_9ACTN|nr:hypothetical protein [Aeromicrobium ginsengisoli]KAA1395672.1 hypothetical protein ESP70_016110 [Aeromicrobium ginsengisoli]
MRLRAAALTLAAGLTLAACGGGNGGSDAKAAKPSGPTPSATAQATVDPKEPSCRFLTSSERTKLAGSPVDTVVATSGTAASSQCRWQSATALIQVTTLPAQAWAKTLPDAVKQLESSGDVKTGTDKKELARAKKLLSGATSFTGKQACDAFTTLAEIGGAKPGATTTITLVPISEAESGVSAQMCTSGEMTSLIYSVPDLKKTKAVEAAVTSALASAQKRALALR